ncbi:MAG: DNA repair protein RadC [Planctomycetia bacterium]|nr:DNA repair protein RadC [Planctomycetia bacterium]
MRRTHPTRIPARHPAAGHRQRLRARLSRAGLDALDDHEILELVLGLAIRGRDTKPLARALLKQFGSFGRVLDAPASDLLAVPGAGPAVAAALQTVKAAGAAYLRDHAARTDALTNPRLVADYCRARFAGEPQEVVAALLLDSRHRVVKTAPLSRGTVDRATAFPREVARAAIEAGAAAVILCHNHPSGNPDPSEQDRVLTREVESALRAVGVRLLDHVVVGREGSRSLGKTGVR